MNPRPAISKLLRFLFSTIVMLLADAAVICAMVFAFAAGDGGYALVFSMAFGGLALVPLAVIAGACFAWRGFIATACLVGMQLFVAVFTALFFGQR